MSDALLQELLDREAIKELKARYLRMVDDRDWTGFRGLFTDDAWFQLRDQEPIEGADGWVEFVRSVIDGRVARTVHRGHMPEITIDSPTEAHGTWMLVDYIEWPPDPATGGRRGMKGYGRYEEDYRKVDGEWKIARWRLEYVRRDPLLPQPLSDRVWWPSAIVEKEAHSIR
jgi:SnoaL-like protein